MTLWPKLLNELNYIDPIIKNSQIDNSPLSHLKKFILFKALGKYNKIKAKNVYKTYNKAYLILIQFIVELMPQKICYLISFFFAKIFNKKTILYDLKMV